MKKIKLAAIVALVVTLNTTVVYAGNSKSNGNSGKNTQSSSTKTSSSSKKDTSTKTNNSSSSEKAKTNYGQTKDKTKDKTKTNYGQTKDKTKDKVSEVTTSGSGVKVTDGKNVASKAKGIGVKIHNKHVQFDVAPFIDKNGRTMVPVAKIAEMFNATSTYDAATSTVIIKNDTVTIELKIGENTILVNGQEVVMDTTAVIKEGRTFVPISAIANAFDLAYSWDSATGTVVIEDPATTEATEETTTEEVTTETTVQ